jgi:hypothetical protein
MPAHDEADAVADPSSRAVGTSQGISRRVFLTKAGAATAVVYLSSIPGAAALLAQEGGSSPAQPPGQAPPLRVRRREDFLSLDFTFDNLVVDASVPAHPVLVRQKAGKAAHIVVGFAPQHLTEEALFQTADGFELPEDDPDRNTTSQGPGGLPMRARLAGGSRLAFVVPASAGPIPYTVEGLLSWTRFAMSVVPNAVRRGETPVVYGEHAGHHFVVHGAKPKPTNPSGLQTAIELPWWLVLSPHSGAGWAHSLEPVTAAGRTELWHTRLGVRAPNGHGGWTVDEDDAQHRTVRAVWARDPKFLPWFNAWNNPNEKVPVALKPADGSGFPKEGLPFRMPLVPKDRYDIVVSSSNFGRDSYTPEPIDVNRLMLTAAGAWIDSRGEFDAATSGTSLLEWRQQGTGGRDHLVRIVRKGYLLPFGHPAALIKVTERKVVPGPGGDPVAYLFQRMFIVVRSPEKRFDDQPFQQPGEGRALPLRRVRLTTTVTPDLDDPSKQKEFVDGVPQMEAFVPRVSGAPFRFHVVARDWVEQRVELSVPLLFVDSEVAVDEMTVPALVDRYNTGTGTAAGITDAPLHGQHVALAPSKEAGDTSVEVSTLVLGATTALADIAGGGSASDQQFQDRDQPRFYPTMREAAIRVTAAEQVSGGALGPTVVTLDEEYVARGFPKEKPHVNPGRVFARVKGAAPLLGFDQGDRAGAVATPSFAISALSRTFGPVGGKPETVAGGTFAPAEFLKGATLLGGIPLSAVLPTRATLVADDASDEVLQITSRTLSDPDDPDGVPTGIETRLHWRPLLQAAPLNVNVFVPADGERLRLDALMLTDLLEPSKSAFTVDGDLRNFVVNLFGDAASTRFLTVRFNRLTFASRDGSKPDVKVDIKQVEFAGVLEFVEKLKDYLPTGGTGPSLDITPTGVTAGFAVALPNIELGVFSLQNIKLGVGLTLPFTGAPARMRFFFCTREDPFFGVGVGVDGVELFEAALEFGAAIAVDFGVASGGVKVVAGIYLLVEKVDQKERTELTGYFKLNGRVDVLGLITASIEFYLGLTYVAKTKKAVGEAILMITVDVLLFSGTVKLECRRRFGGANDPTFGELVAPEHWDAYCEAFEPVAA